MKVTDYKTLRWILDSKDAKEKGGKFNLNLNFSQILSIGVFRILILRVPSVNRIFPLRVLTAGAISLFLNITGAIAPMAPVLNTPLQLLGLYLWG